MRRRAIYWLVGCLTVLVSLSLLLLRPQPYHALDNRGAVIRAQLQRRHFGAMRQPCEGCSSFLSSMASDFSSAPAKRGRRGGGKHPRFRPTQVNHGNNSREGLLDAANLHESDKLPKELVVGGVSAIDVTYDDIFRRTIDEKHYVLGDSGSDARGPADALSPFQTLCDDVAVPFDSDSATERCIAFMKAVMQHVASLDANATNSFSVPCSVLTLYSVSFPACDDPSAEGATLTIEPMKQQFEQRTIKFKATLRLSSATEGSDPSATAPAAWIVKVPQVLFPIEPFAEVAAHHFDRKLGINRVPPTGLVAVPIAWIRSVSLTRSEKKMSMVHEFLVASNVATYDEWIEKDFVAFLRHDEGGRYVADKNATLAWCSVQLFMREVQPILSSTLRVPYSKQNPGWHRWFDVQFSEYPVPLGPLLALSELSVFDFIIRNNDRSPNKNNFIVGACKKCWPRRPSGTVPTLVHLDHGMSFYGPNSHTVHNPLSKSKEKLKFCIFYRPLVERLRRIGNMLLQGNSTTVRTMEDAWERYLSANISAPVVTAIGSSKLSCGSQVVKVLARVDTCVRLFNESAVLRP
jgi:hypothetical protein